MSSRLSAMTDEQLRFELKRRASVSGKTAAKAYMAALNEAIRREENSCKGEPS
jgi:hypothetical protein